MSKRGILRINIETASGQKPREDHARTLFDLYYYHTQLLASVRQTDDSFDAIQCTVALRYNEFQGEPKYIRRSVLLCIRPLQSRTEISIPQL